MALLPSAQPRCQIVGRGAIGLLAASRLQLAGWQVNLWLRQAANLDCIFVPAEGEPRSLHFPAAEAPLTLLLVPVKAYAVQNCLRQLAPVLAADAQLIVSHNGMPDLGWLQQQLAPGQGLWFLSTSHAALRSADGVQHSGLGQSVLAPLNAKAQQATTSVVAMLDTALGPVTLTDDIRPALWRKLAVNAAINPLTAIHQCRNGALAAADYQPLLAAIVNEVCLVAGAEGISLLPAPTLALVQQVIANTAHNYSSMQQDVNAGRQTEIAAITGYIVSRAARHGLAVPENLALWQALRHTA
ncbi:2-dehydropantoate 2-reductase [Alishewanella aestuarii B11]|uniref:2-dehydropantoate 2-reductase n=1 Tax=Alishewanella aestuarii B11 TaxID=1197174 RepID=J1Q4G0_9ALTE|nr:2-dehydropantoate 2-reductase [Alishewanella aestuarii]EJI86008.1 2-dehydropantoate 2-reductase [Alishewanella aestuarii B11]